MKKLRYAIPLAFALAMPMLAHAQGAPGRHPAYLHALSDLHDARWFLGHGPEGFPVDERERRAIEQIDRAIDEVRRAAYYDGKDLYERPREDAYPDARGRLRRVSELLRKARSDVAMPEDNLNVRDFQYHAVERIDNAIRLAEGAMLDRERARDYERDRDRDYDRR
jgi:hypothetical protein